MSREDERLGTEESTSMIDEGLLHTLRKRGVSYGTDDELPPRAWLSEPLGGGSWRCLACENRCRIHPGYVGKCGVRAVLQGELRCLSHGRTLAAYPNPSEMKPLYHFLPGAQQLSIGTAGCNARCTWCQNHHMSVVEDLPRSLGGSSLMDPAEVVAECLKTRSPAASFTFNEPTVWLEWTLEACGHCRKAGVLTTFVTNGYQVASIPLSLYSHIRCAQASGAAMNALIEAADGANVDLKSGDNDSMRRHCGLRGDIVRRNIAALVKGGVWVEVTTLVVPGVSDSDDGLRSIASFLVGLSRDVPWHVTAFHPDHHMTDRPRTSRQTLMRAHKLGREAGLRYVYTGNCAETGGQGYEDTSCPSCGTVLIQRGKSGRLDVRERWTERGRCHGCGAQIPGLWSPSCRVPVELT